MTREQLILVLLQKTQQEANDQALGEWLRTFVRALDLGENNGAADSRKILFG